MKPATCFPNARASVARGTSPLAYELGAALARECQAHGVHLLLGPGINIRRRRWAGAATNIIRKIRC